MTAAVIAAFRWHEDAHLLAIATSRSCSPGTGGGRGDGTGRGWPPRHAIGVGGSYIALVTGFYVDNGPFLPLWDRLPHWAYWIIPTAVGAPLIWRAVHRFQHSGRLASDASCSLAPWAVSGDRQQDSGGQAADAAACVDRVVARVECRAAFSQQALRSVVEVAGDVPG